MTTVEKAAYLKGLVEGLGVDPASRDGKLWGALTELLSDMAHEIEDLQASSLDMAEALDDLGEDLSYLENLALDLDLPEDFEDGEDEDAYIPDLRLYEPDDVSDEEDEELEAEVLYDVTCPACGEEITFDEETLEAGSITCPGCGELLEFDLGEDE